MITLYVLCGIPGSGKTTLAHELAEQHGAKVHSYDDVYDARAVSETAGTVKKRWIDAMNADLLAGHSVVCDGINLTVETRKWIMGQLVPCKKVLMVKVVPLETCLERNRQRKARLPDFVVEQSAQKMEAPTKDEGWDEIYLSEE